MEYTFLIPGRLPGLNEYVKANRNNRYDGGKMKKESEEYIKQYIIAQNVPKFNKVFIEYTWIEQNMKRDLDNISGMGRKLINDSLVSLGIIPNDGWKNVTGFTDSFEVDKYNPRISIRIVEVME